MAAGSTGARMPRAGRTQALAQHAGRGAEILVAHVAPAHDGGLPVGRERLVVHAPVGAQGVRQVAQGLGPAQREGVEQAHLDARVAVQRGQRGVQARGAHVVQQQAHAHAAPGGGQQFAQQQRAGGVAAPDVVLHVQRALGRARQQRAGGEGVVRMVQRVDAAAPRVGRRAGRQRAPQAGGARVRNRMRKGCGRRGFACVAWGHGSSGVLLNE
jgi:hypothetical protein